MKKITLTESELKSLIENMVNKDKTVEIPKQKKTITLSESELKTLIENVINKAEDELINEAKGEKWIQGAIKHKGALKKELGVKKGEKIPTEKLNKTIASLEKKGEGDKKLTEPERKELKRAVLAKTLKGLKK